MKNKNIALLIDCENTAGDDAWSHMSAVTQYIKNQKSYSPVNYGFKSWSKLIQATELFEGEIRNGSAIYIRDKRRKAVDQPDAVCKSSFES